MAGSVVGTSSFEEWSIGLDELDLRVLFIFDPISTTVLLLGGDKRDRWRAWYESAISAADDLYDHYLLETNLTTGDT